MHAMEALRFLHIPKTAGTTFTSILKRQYFGKKSFRLTNDVNYDMGRYSALSDEDRKKIALYIGHAPITTGIEGADSATTITFLREPVSRVKSFCQHVAEGKSPYLLDVFPPDTFSLDAFLESGISELSNLQAKTLVNSRTGESNIFDKMSAEDASARALYNLSNKISYYGIQEYFNESLIIFSTALNWRVPVYTSKNRKKNSKLICFEERHLEKIAELNAIDIEVYKYAKENFEKLIEKMPSEKLKQLQLKNMLGAPFIPLEDKIVSLIEKLFHTEV